LGEVERDKLSLSRQDMKNNERAIADYDMAIKTRSELCNGLLQPRQFASRSRRQGRCNWRLPASGQAQS
jgi:hypothetical protein